MKKFNKLVQILKDHRVLIQTHNCPDPDALASAYGLQYLLRSVGIDSVMVYDGEINKLSGSRVVNYFQMQIMNYHEMTDLSEDDYVIIVDAQKYNKNCTDITGQEVACIDHHPTETVCEYLFKDIRLVGACSSIISEYIVDAGLVPPVDVATVLLYGIKMDTNDFSRGVSELDAEMYYKLFPYADQGILTKMSVNSLEFSDLPAYGEAINRISVYKNIGFTGIPFDCPDGLIAIISDFILALDVVEISIVYSKRESGYKFSVRTEVENVDSGRVIRGVTHSYPGGSGGGHSFMAGGFIPKEAIKQIKGDPNTVLLNQFIHLIYPEEKDYEKDIICNKRTD